MAVCWAKPGKIRGNTDNFSYNVPIVPIVRTLLQIVPVFTLFQLFVLFKGEA